MPSLRPKKFVPHDWKRRSYETRDLVLAQLGFSSYAAYLQSDLWATIRRNYLAKFPECFGCGAPANQIHHKHYNADNLSGRSPSGLLSICGSCHERIEFKPSGMKVPLGEANRWLFKIREQNFPESRAKREAKVRRRKERRLAKRQQKLEGHKQ